MLLDQLNPLLIREVALYLPDPGGLAGAFAAAWHAVRDEAFALEWFNRWQPILTPHRPWQYSVITWHRSKIFGSTPEQLAGVMLRYLAWQKQQQQDLQHQLLCSTTDIQTVSRLVAYRHQALPVTASAATAGAQVEQQQQQQSPANKISRCSEPLLRTTFGFEGITTSFPSCQPAPSVIRAANKLLCGNQGLAALFLLCPASSTLLLPYCMKARNSTLVSHIIDRRRSLRCHHGAEDVIYPRNYVECSRFFALVPMVEVASYAAMGSHWPDMLTMMLATRSHTCSYIARALLRHGARHSNAACLQPVLVYAAATGAAQPSPDHLAAAAARTDPSAAAVVRLLLEHLPAKQQTAKWLKSAYRAACGSCNAAVLDVLLLHAAAARGKQQQQHVLAVLEACAKTANTCLWKRLIGLHSKQAGCPSCSSSSVCGRQQPQQQPLLPLQAASSITPQQWVDLLHAVLPTVSLHYTHSRPREQQQECSNRLAMADQLWQLVQAADQAAAVQQLVTVKAGPGGILLSAAARQLLFLTSNKQGHICTKQMYMLNERYWWLQLHGLTLGRISMPSVGSWVQGALAAGEHHYALQLYRKWRECNAVLLTRGKRQPAAGAAAATGGAAAASSRGAAAEAASAILSPAATPLQSLTDTPAASEVGSALSTAVRALDEAAAAVFARAGSTRSASAAAAAVIVDAPVGATGTEPGHKTQAAPCTAAGSSGQVTHGQQGKEDLIEVAGVLLTSRLCAAAATGDLNAARQVVLFTALAGMLVSQGQYRDGKVELPRIRWVDTAKLCGTASLCWWDVCEQLGLSRECFWRLMPLDSAGTAPSSTCCGSNKHQGAMPLWQQVLLKLLAVSPLKGVLRICDTYLLADIIESGAGVQQLQKLLDAGVLGDTRLGLMHTLGSELVVTAASQMRPELLAWALEPQQERLWGTGNRQTLVCSLCQHTSLNNPIDCRGRRWWHSKEEQENQQLLRYQQQLHGMSPAATAPLVVPPVLQSQVNSALLALQPPEPPSGTDVCSNWITKHVRAGSSKLHLLRAKVILATVASSKELPQGARILNRTALRQVLLTGDLDLLAVLLMWAARLDVDHGQAVGHNGDEVDGAADMPDVVVDALALGAAAPVGAPAAFLYDNNI